jgi:Fur family peroxide stress response transcriptional regulator
MLRKYYRDPMTTPNFEQVSIQIASERLRRAGYRVTRQRLAVYAFLHGSVSHPTVEEIHTAVRDAFPMISVATVYKSVESLVDIGMVKPIYLGHAATRYDASSEEHAHFRCIACNHIMDVPVEKSPVARGELDRCEVIGARVEFYGFCPGCRRRKLGLAADQGVSAK